MAWALRTRVNRSAMGSVMLMKTSFRVHRYPIKPEINQIVSQHRSQPALRRPPTISALPGFSESRCGSRISDGDMPSHGSASGRNAPSPAQIKLPTGLAQTRHVAAHGGFAQLVAAQAELGIDGTRTAGQCATRTLAYRAGVARQLLQLALGVHLLLVGGGGAQYDRLQFGALGGVLLSEF